MNRTIVHIGQYNGSSNLAYLSKMNYGKNQLKAVITRCGKVMRENPG